MSSWLWVKKKMNALVIGKTDQARLKTVTCHELNTSGYNSWYILIQKPTKAECCFQTPMKVFVIKDRSLGQEAFFFSDEMMNYDTPLWSRLGIKLSSEVTKTQTLCWCQQKADADVSLSSKNLIHCGTSAAIKQLTPVRSTAAWNVRDSKPIKYTRLRLQWGKSSPGTDASNWHFCASSFLESCKLIKWAEQQTILQFWKWNRNTPNPELFSS